jgi:3-oxoacyl-[acyl-carrier-protein] synthase-3
MDGPELVKFSLDVAPPLVERVLAAAKWRREEVDLYLIHQATVFLLDHLRERLSLDREHTPEALRQYGNTVSSTIPILIDDLRRSGRLRPGKQTVMIGFGVGLSWAGCVWTETWAAEQVQVAQQGPQKAEPAADQPVAAPKDEKATAKDSDESREAA